MGSKIRCRSPANKKRCSEKPLEARDFPAEGGGSAVCRCPGTASHGGVVPAPPADAPQPKWRFCAPAEALESAPKRSRPGERGSRDLWLLGSVVVPKDRRLSSVQRPGVLKVPKYPGVLCPRALGTQKSSRILWFVVTNRSSKTNSNLKPGLGFFG